MISVIIPLYNKEEYIGRAIDSVLGQSFTEFEIVVVNDGSKDKGADIVAQYGDARIRLIEQENQGVSGARNRGISEARFDTVAFLDADDVWLEDHLRDIAMMEDRYPECGVYGTSYYFKSEGNDPTAPILPFSPKMDEGGMCVLDCYYQLASGTDFPIHMSSYAVKKKYIEMIGGFPVGIKSGEDIITLAKLFSVCDFAYCSRPSSIYYLIKEGKSERPTTSNNPLDKEFDELIDKASHRKGVRRYVSSWHKRRMVAAIYAGKYGLAMRELIKGIRFDIFHKKLWTSLILTIISKITKKDLYTLNQSLKKKK